MPEIILVPTSLPLSPFHLLITAFDFSQKHFAVNHLPSQQKICARPKKFSRLGNYIFLSFLHDYYFIYVLPGKFAFSGVLPRKSSGNQQGNHSLLARIFSLSFSFRPVGVLIIDVYLHNSRLQLTSIAPPFIISLQMRFNILNFFSSVPATPSSLRRRKISLPSGAVERSDCT
jgi:hypothetical protein